jgi:hypothetical protein
VGRQGKTKKADARADNNDKIEQNKTTQIEVASCKFEKCPSDGFDDTEQTGKNAQLTAEQQSDTRSRYGKC